MSKSQTNPFKALASQFLNSALPVDRLKLRLQVQDKLEQVDSGLSRTALYKLFSISYYAGEETSQKLVKGKQKGFLTLGLYLSPASKSGKNLCTFASNGCMAACLDESGHNLLEKLSGNDTIDVSRVLKSWVLEFRKDLAYKLLAGEIASKSRKAQKQGKSFAVRLNCTSDVDFSDLIAQHPEVQFYDYTKDPKNTGADNHHITFSWGGFSKGRKSHYKAALERGFKIAFPIIKADVERVLQLPETLEMDSTDLRFLDPVGNYGILAVKETGNTAKGIQEGFFLDYNNFRNAIAWINS